MNTRNISYIDPQHLGTASTVGGIGAGLAGTFVNPTESLPEFGGLVGGAALGAIPGIYGGAAVDRLISPKNSNVGNTLALLIAAGMPITSGLLGKSLFDNE